MSVLTLADAKAHLNITTAANDVELQATIDAAEGVITRRIGAIAATQFTTRVEGEGRDRLLLPKTPVISLTSVTPLGGTALTVGDLYVHSGSGVVEFADGGYFTARRYDIVYQAGYATVPNDLLQAIKELTRHLWESQRARLRSRGAGNEGDSITPGGYLIPYRVEALLAAFEPPGMA